VPTHGARARVLAPGEEPSILRIGITGHQSREGADWLWVAHELRSALSSREPPFQGWTSLAAGADQAFASAVLDRGGTLITVVPILGYERFFDREEDLEEYRRLRRASQQVIQLDHSDSAEAFFAAGRRIVDECNWLIAVWDRRPSKGLGGTADIVAYAHSLNRPVLVLNPIDKSTQSAGPAVPS
jgi:hypothetical protein